MPKDYAAEYVPSKLDDRPDLDLRIVPADFGPRGAVLNWWLIEPSTATVINESSSRHYLYGVVRGIEWERNRSRRLV